MVINMAHYLQYVYLSICSFRILIPYPGEKQILQLCTGFLCIVFSPDIVAVSRISYFLPYML